MRIYILCALFLLVGTPAAREITVAQDGSGDFATISTALAEARDGTVISVGPGVYHGSVAFDSDQRHVSIIGAGPGLTVIDADSAYAAVELRGRRNRVSGLTLRGAESHGAYVNSGRHYIDRCLITGNGDRGVYFSSFDSTAAARIDHCTIVRNSVSGIYSPMDHPRTKVLNSIIAFNSRGIVGDENNGRLKVAYCCVHNEGADFDDVDEGTANVTDDPLFTNVENDDYTLGPASPCISSAGDGLNIGCYTDEQ
jgi:hypothetical protein